jgi:nucleoid-associated protein YgaU
MPALEQLKQRYQSALAVVDKERIQLQNLHEQDNKLFVRGIAPSEDAKGRFFTEVKRINPSMDDITADITVQASPGGAGGASGATQTLESYTVKAGDTLSKIAKQFYGDANEYMRIYHANRTILNDPDRIQVGQVLVIPRG